MKILKYIIFLILILLIGSAIYFGTKDGSYVIWDTKTIDAPSEVVFDKINNLKSWESWSPWLEDGSTQSFTYAEKTSGEGASFSWDGKIGGSLVTTKVIPNKEIEQELTYMTSLGDRQAKIHWEFEEIDDATKVTWTIKGLHSLTDKVSAAIYQDDFNAEVHKKNQIALNKISSQIEEEMKKYSIHVDGLTEYGGGYYLYTTTVAKQYEVNDKIFDMLQVVNQFIEKNRLNPSGKPMVIYNEINDESGTVIFSVGVPVKEKVITPDNSPIVSGFMDRVSTVKISLKGNYKNLPEAYIKGRAYINKNSLQINERAKIFEIYQTDPAVEKNPANWVTDIYIPVESISVPSQEGFNFN